MRKEIKDIRENEKIYHENFYEKETIYEQGSWLSQPAKNVMESLNCVDITKEINVLDIGCGAGRHSIAIAQMLKPGSAVDCVDILDSAVEMLLENARKYGVEEKINGIVQEIDDFFMTKQRKYDFIVAVSALEHVRDENTFDKVMTALKNHLTEAGVICLIINSGIIEKDKYTGEAILSQFEINMTTDILLDKLRITFKEEELIKEEIKHLNYEIFRGNRAVNLTTNAVTYIVKHSKKTMQGV